MKEDETYEDGEVDDGEDRAASRTMRRIRRITMGSNRHETMNKRRRRRTSMRRRRSRRRRRR